MFNRRVQFILWNYWLGVGFRKWTDSYNSRILDFSFNFAFLEVRVWKKGAHETR